MAQRWLPIALMLGAVGLGGCSWGPDVGELGAELQREGNMLLTEVADTSAVDGTVPTVTEDASKDIPCGDAKVKRVFAGSFPFEPHSDLDNTFDFGFSAVWAAIDTERYGYDFHQGYDNDDLVGRKFTFTGKDDYKVTLTFVFTAGKTPTFALHGETACLNA